MKDFLEIPLDLYEKIKYCINNKHVLSKDLCEVKISNDTVIIKRDILYSLLFYMCNNIENVINVGIINKKYLEDKIDEYNNYVDKYNDVRFKIMDNVNGKYLKIATDVFCQYLMRNKNELRSFVDNCYDLINIYHECYHIIELFSQKREFLRNLHYVTTPDVINEYKDRYNAAIQSYDLEEIKRILKDGENLVLNSWKNYTTKVEDFDDSKPFRFICHSTKSTTFDGSFFTKYISCSLLTENLLDTYRDGFGFILAPANIVGASSTDLNSVNEANSIEDALINNSIKLISPPERVLSETLEKKEKLKSEDVRYQVYNEILIESFNPIGIFCITDGSKEFNKNYVNARKLRMSFPDLKIVEIDETLHKSPEEMFFVKKNLIENILGKKVLGSSVFDYELFWQEFMKLKSEKSYDKNDILKLFMNNYKLLYNVNFDELFTKYSDEEIKFILYYNVNTRIIDILSGDYDFLNLNGIYNTLRIYEDNPKLDAFVPGLTKFLKIFPKCIFDDSTIERIESQNSIEDINNVLSKDKHL